MKEINKEWLDWVLSVLVLSIILNFAIILSVAALSGSWEVQVRFNDLREGPLELVLAFLFIALQSRNIVRQWKDIREHQRKTKKEQAPNVVCPRCNIYLRPKQICPMCYLKPEKLQIPNPPPLRTADHSLKSKRIDDEQPGQ